MSNFKGIDKVLENKTKLTEFYFSNEKIYSTAYKYEDFSSCLIPENNLTINNEPLVLGLQKLSNLKNLYLRTIFDEQLLSSGF